MPRRLWTQARIAALTRLWRAGKTAGAIGKALGGISRSAVLGKVFRLRLDAAPRRGSARPPGDAPARRRAGKAPPPATSNKSRRKTLFELTNEGCRWPYGELGERRFLFCGAAGADLAHDIPYCPRHMERAYIIPPTLLKSNMAKPLQRMLAPVSKGDAGWPSRSFPRKRESTLRKFGS